MPEFKEGQETPAIKSSDENTGISKSTKTVSSSPTLHEVISKVMHRANSANRPVRRQQRDYQYSAVENPYARFNDELHQNVSFTKKEYSRRRRQKFASYQDKVASIGAAYSTTTQPTKINNSSNSAPIKNVYKPFSFKEPESPELWAKKRKEKFISYIKNAAESESIATPN